MDNPTTIERAFALARSGEYESLAHIRLRLRQERYTQIDEHLRGPSIRRQLKGLCKKPH